ncbi:hypothetical protein [Bacillus xiapuensis]|uniref:hypothetical protein n=1 Tax=Bacillus xiapuensis TaxID=2014075 RepID=UPI0012FD3ED5|nr:hypothetical protein [Bacillus xiapuensis]
MLSIQQANAYREEQVEELTYCLGKALARIRVLENKVEKLEDRIRLVSYADVKL